MKVTAIEATNNIAFLKLDELFDSLRTFELTPGDNDSKRDKKVALHFVSDENIQHNKEHLNYDILANSIALLNEHVSNVLRSV